MNQEVNWTAMVKRWSGWIALLGLVVIGLVYLRSVNTSAPAPSPQETPASVSAPMTTPTPAPTSRPTPFGDVPAFTPLPAFSPTPTNLPFTSPISPFRSPLALPTANQGPEPVIYGYKVVHTYPHDPGAFTQGLVFLDDVLYEGTGLLGQSSLRKVDLETGQVLQLYRLPLEFFGEGIAIYGDELFQLTWKSQIGFIYDKDSFSLGGEFYYPTEGWGLTHDGQQLIMSDGTANLYFRDPETLAEIRRVEVHDPNGPVANLNELEYVKGQVYANVWKTNRLAIIDPQTGQVTGWVELDGLLKPEDLSQRVDVLNGIAYDAAGDRLFVTGKWWPKLFEVELIPQE